MHKLQYVYVTLSRQCLLMTPAAAFEVERTVKLQHWFNTVSRAFEVMPFLFVVGGFAGLATCRSSRTGTNDVAPSRSASS